MSGIFGSKSSAPAVVETVAAVPAPAPAAPASSDASLEEFSDEELDAKKKKTKAQGTKALQIPLGSTGETKTIGVV